MLVRDVMTANVAAIDPDMPVRDVTALMELRRVRHFPILEGGSGGVRLVGIVSDRDLRAVGSPHPSARPGVSVQDPVRRIMSAPVFSAHPDDSIEDAARRLRRHRVGALPVLEDGRLVGIVTAADLIDALAGMRAGATASSRMEVELPNRPGALAGLLTAIARLGLNVSTVSTTRSDAEAVAFAIRVDTIDVTAVAASLRRAGFAVLWPVSDAAADAAVPT
jgi:acetoin utilization protein AcuB